MMMRRKTIEVSEIYIAPPDPAVLTDEDSGGDEEDGQNVLPDRLNSHQLLADAEVYFSSRIDREDE